jgi:hypothetical protein
MTETAGFGTSWLPASVQRRMAVEDQAERREARRAEAERQDRQESAHERAVGAYRAAAEQRGEVVSALQLAAGQGIGRSVEDVFADAVAAAEREDARAAARQRHEDGGAVLIDAEPRIRASRSAWPESEYELDRMLREASELHRSLVMTQSRLASRQGRGAEHIEAMRRDRGASAAGTGTITRYAPTPACSGCGHVRCQCR